jgi:hypothetical protein
MFNISKYITSGLKNTLKLLNGTNFSYKGPWVQVYDNTVLDQWYVGDFFGAEYTICVDHNTSQKEIIKCLVVSGPDTAGVTIYGRSNLGNPLITITASVDSSRVSVIVNPKSNTYRGSKIFFSANYYSTVNELMP